MNAGERKLCFSFLCRGPGLLGRCMDFRVIAIGIHLLRLLLLGNALRTIIETISQLKEKLKPDQSFRLHRLHLMQEQSCLEVSTCKQFPCLKGRGLAAAS